MKTADIGKRGSPAKARRPMFLAKKALISVVHPIKLTYSVVKEGGRNVLKLRCLIKIVKENNNRDNSPHVIALLELRGGCWATF